MKKENLLAACFDIAQSIGFDIDPHQKPWLPQLNPGEFREIKQRGFFKYKYQLGRTPATLNIIPLENLSPILRQEMEQKWQIYEAYCVIVAGIPNAVRLAQRAQTGTFQDRFAFLVSIEPEDQWLIPDCKSGQPKIAPGVIDEFARIYWATTEAMKKLVETCPEAAAWVRQWTATEYFIERLAKWLEEGRRNKAEERGFISPSLKDMVISKLMSRAFYRSMEMGMFFNLFGNTDIIKTSDGNYVLTNGDFAVKPRSFGPAAFIWNLMMHCWHFGRLGFVPRIYEWLSIFSNIFKDNIHDREMFFQEFEANLLERCLATLLVDLPNRRSPYDQADTTEADTEQSKVNFTYVLKFLVSF